MSSLAPKDNVAVIQKFEKVASRASKTGFKRDSAIASYLCAEFCLSKPDQAQSVDRFLHQAFDQYTAWGATAVAAYVQKRHPSIFPEEFSKVEVPRSSGFRSRRHFRPSLADMNKSISTAKRVRGDSFVTLESIAQP